MDSFTAALEGGGMPEEGFQWSVPSVVISPKITRNFSSLASPFFLNLPQPLISILAFFHHSSSCDTVLFT
eukprot:UN15694